MVEHFQPCPTGVLVFSQSALSRNIISDVGKDEGSRGIGVLDSSREVTLLTVVTHRHTLSHSVTALVVHKSNNA